MTHFTNNARTKRRAAFTAPYPGRIIPLEPASVGGSLICRKNAFPAAAYGTRLSIEFDKRIGAGFFGGEGLFPATLRGHGTLWLQSLPFSRPADRIIRSSRYAAGHSKGEGSPLGGLGNLFGDR